MGSVGRLNWETVVAIARQRSERRPMKKASEYRQHAEECRTLARGMAPGSQRDQLVEMAATWEKLAEERSELVRRHPELALVGEHAEEAGAKS
jgi:hypothetical protein